MASDVVSDEMSTGTHMQAVRQAAGMDAAKLARIIGEDRTALMHYESGRRRPPVRVLQAYEDVLGLPPGALRPDAPHDEHHPRQIAIRDRNLVVEKVEEFFGEKSLEPTTSAAPDTAQDGVNTAQGGVNQILDAIETAGLFPHGGVIRGRATMQTTAMKLLEIVANADPPHDADPPHKKKRSQLLISYQTETPGVRMKQLKEVLKKRQGDHHAYEVHIGYRLGERSEDDQFKMILNMLEVAGVGLNRYSARSIGGAPTLPEALVVPGVFALVFHRSEPGQTETASFFSVRREPERVQAYTERLRAGFRACPYIVQVFGSGAPNGTPNDPSPPVSRVRFNMAVSSLLAGNTFVIKDGLSIFAAMPIEIDDERLTRALGRTDDWFAAARTLIEQRQSLLSRFRHLLKDHESIHMISRTGIENMVKTGEIPDDWLREKLTSHEQWLYLEAVLDMLDQYPNTLKMAFVRDNAEPKTFVIGAIDYAERLPGAARDEAFDGGVTYFEVFRTDHKTQRQVEIDIEVRSRLIAEIFMRAQRADYDEASRDPHRSRESVKLFLASQRDQLVS